LAATASLTRENLMNVKHTDLRFLSLVLLGAGTVLVASGLLAADREIPPNQFVEVDRSDVGGHFFSQVIYAPSERVLVSWGTQTHHHPIRTHETRHFVPGDNQWIDAIPAGMAQRWDGAPKQWPDWDICETAGAFYERDGVALPEPTNSFYQVCWDEHNERLVFYVASMTFSYDPVGRQWKQIYDRSQQGQPPALLLWSSLCYDPVNKQVLLFGGGGVDRADGRPHTWALDVTTDRWRQLELEVEPPARCNSRMVYDRKHECIVLFGGDGQDRVLADTWLFDVHRQQWSERRPASGPYPRSCHALAYLDSSGKVLLVGGRVVADYRMTRQLESQAWVYDVGENRWVPVDTTPPELEGNEWASMENVVGTDEVIYVVTSKYDHRQKTYRFRYDAAAAPGEFEGVAPGTAVLKTDRTPEWYADVAPPDREAHAALLSAMPANRWVEVKPPKSTKGRTWGTSLFDPRASLAMKWGGGHSGYQGTDMAFYNVATNRFTIDRAPAFTPEPFDRWARRPCGRTFFNQPWARHMRHTCAYDSVCNLGVFTDAGGSKWYDRQQDDVVKHTWLYEPARQRWLEPIPQPFPGGGTISPIAAPTRYGVFVYQRGIMYQFNDSSGAYDWRELPHTGNALPRQHEFMTMVYDSKRDRLIMLSEDERKQPQLWFFAIRNSKWTVNPHPAPNGVVTREAIYVPNEDAILAYGPGRKEDPIWTHVYLCAENRWLPLKIETPRFTMHEVAIEYDPLHDVAVLLWPPRFEQDIRPHLLRLEVSEIE
jgi:hypothetical protein